MWTLPLNLAGSAHGIMLDLSRSRAMMALARSCVSTWCVDHTKSFVIRGIARIFLKGVLVSLARLYLQLVRCIVLWRPQASSAFSLET